MKTLIEQIEYFPEINIGDNTIDFEVVETKFRVDLWLLT